MLKIHGKKIGKFSFFPEIDFQEARLALFTKNLG